MPAIPIVVGAMSVYAGATAVALGTMTLAGIAAGAALLGGVAMIAGTLKGGAEGAKWTSDGGMLATIGSLGMNFAGTGAEAAAIPEGGMTATGTTAAGADSYAIADTAVNTGASAIPDATTSSLIGGVQTDAQLVGAAGNTTAFSGNPLATISAASQPTYSMAPSIDTTGTKVISGGDAAVRGAATNQIPTSAQPGAGYNWDAAAGKWQPPSSSLTSNNNMMTLLGNSMNGYSQGQNTQAQIDAMKELQNQRIQADQARVAASQYNPLLTASNR